MRSCLTVERVEAILRELGFEHVTPPRPTDPPYYRAPFNLEIYAFHDVRTPPRPGVSIQILQRGSPVQNHFLFFQESKSEESARADIMAAVLHYLPK